MNTTYKISVIAGGGDWSKTETGKEPRIMPEFGTLNGSPIAEMRL